MAYWKPASENSDGNQNLDVVGVAGMERGVLGLSEVPVGQLRFLCCWRFL